MIATLGWDIGGVNTKVARVAGRDVLGVVSRPFELQRAPQQLVPLLRALAAEVGAPRPVAHAVTMTAELSQMFRTKREGVAFVVTAVEHAFPSSSIQVYTVDGRFLSPDEARREWLTVAAANWSATAHAIAPHHPDSVLIDIGTTTADIIPIVNGAVVAEGRTDPERLASGELVYCGALRTPVEAIVSHVPLGDAVAGVSAEGFALAGDVHVWRGDLDPAEYTVPTPDGRPVSRVSCGERLARVVCADPELLDEAAIMRIADAVAAAQIGRVADAIQRVAARHRSIGVAVVTGLGAFLGAAAARAAGLPILSLAAEVGDDEARYAPAVSVAILLERALNRVSQSAPVSNLGTMPNSRPRSTRSDRSREPLTSDDTSVAASGARRPVASTSIVSSAKSVVGSGFRLRAPGDPWALGRTVASAEVVNRTVGMPKPSVVDTVVKLGGGVFAHEPCFASVLETIAEAARTERLLVVPGGGLFADLVREIDRRHHLSDATAHWMAILAMDQYAHVIAEKLAGAALVADRETVAASLEAGRVPVLAPSRWVRALDPLPHSWDVTSDSIAAWIAGQVGARRLVLVKPPGVTSGASVDAHFRAAVPAEVEAIVVAADRLDVWQETL